MSNHPEHDKLRAVMDDSSTICHFLHWLASERGLGIGRWSEDGMHLEPLTIGLEWLVAEYFEIDLAKIEGEKRVMVAELRAGVGA
jgi:hypothetical protein